MANDKLTIAQVKEMQDALQTEIYGLVEAFEKDTGLKVRYIDMNREYDEPYQVEPCREGKLKEVNIDLDMEL